MKKVLILFLLNLTLSQLFSLSKDFNISFKESSEEIAHAIYQKLTNKQAGIASTSTPVPKSHPSNNTKQQASLKVTPPTENAGPPS
jgi:hypothetical protein